MTKALVIEETMGILDRILYRGSLFSTHVGDEQKAKALDKIQCHVVCRKVEIL
jgi:hypothetical protein